MSSGVWVAGPSAVLTVVSGIQCKCSQTSAPPAVLLSCLTTAGSFLTGLHPPGSGSRGSGLWAT